jgi:hypothetical protein
MIMTLAAGVAGPMVKRAPGARCPWGGAGVVTPQGPGHSACWRASGMTKRGAREGGHEVSTTSSAGTASPWVTPPRSLPPGRHAASWPEVPAGRKIWNAAWLAGRSTGLAAAGVLIASILGRAFAAISRRHAE